MHKETHRYAVPIICCEGSSEFNYLARINRLLHRPECGAVCSPLNMNQGDFTAVKNFLKRLKKEAKTREILIWVDKDIYVRNTGHCYDNYCKKSEDIPDFFFSIMNFEDFMMLHLDANTLTSYERALQKKKHFDTPLDSVSQLSILDSHVKNYRKGDLPFDLDRAHLEAMFRNRKNTNIQCGLADWLENEIESGKIVYR
jgi:hypothetical protein